MLSDTGKYEMGERPDSPPSAVPSPPVTRGTGIIGLLIALALILAIGFFYMTNDHRRDRQADAVTDAATAMDDAARIVSTAAKNAADSLRKRD